MDIYDRLKRAFLVLVLVMLLGTGGLFVLGRGNWSLEDCFYMTVVTISTVGYGEVIPVGDVPHGRLFLVALMLGGVGTVVYFGSSIIALAVESDLQNVWRRRKMDRKIQQISEHVILCGAGVTGKHVIRELVTTRTPFVAIDRSEERLQNLGRRFGLDQVLYIEGDATDDAVLSQAGILRAQGIIVALPSDKDCLIVTVIARQMNPNIRIVSKCQDDGLVERVVKAGANSVVSPNYIGGMRMVSEMIRPRVTEFLDIMLRDKDQNLRIEEVEVPERSPIAGRPLKDTQIRKITDLLVVAAKNKETGTYTYNPGSDFVVEGKSALIVLGTTDDVIKLRKAVQPGRRTIITGRRHVGDGSEHDSGNGDLSE